MVEQQKKCRRPGCNKMYLESENSDTNCLYHPGKPIFHDLKKGWDCCGKIAWEWPEFEKIVGCTKGRCTDDKSVAQKEFYSSQTVAHASNAIKKADLTVVKTAADFNAEEQKKKEEKAAAEAKLEQKPVMTKDGKRCVCGNKGCTKKSFLPEENGPEACNYHPGEPIFHDIKKYWSCCTASKPAYDWDDFMKIPTCAVGEHIMKYKPQK